MLRPWRSCTNPTRELRICVCEPACACFGTGSTVTLKLLCASVQRVKKCSVPNRVSPSCHTRHLHVLVRSDLFVINRETYFLVSDYYSKFPFVYMIPSPVRSIAAIRNMKSLFSEQGSLSTTTCDQLQWRPIRLRCNQEVR